MATKTRSESQPAKSKQAVGRKENADRYVELLANLLKDGKPVSSREIHHAMAKAGASDSMIGRAKRELGDVNVTRMKGEATDDRATTGLGRATSATAGSRVRESSSRW